ncbi:hypothetical protein [Kitasatospora sp. NPDC088346]|uniref:hypothetical protein n=1 Tax=Kitasatospora sp. NPDC088346 TaxID=3364073 RepID=UPI003813DD7F
MTRSTQLAVPAVASGFVLAFAALFVLRSCAPDTTPPSPAGQWRTDGTPGPRLALLDDGRLGPSLIPAAACHDAPEPGATDELWDVADGTWEATYETDAGDQVEIAFAQPSRCHLMLSSQVESGGNHTLRLGAHDTSWTLKRP